MTEWTVFGIAASVVVKLLVNALKALGLPSKLALWAALIVGVALGVCNQFATQSPAFATWYHVVFSGIVAALVASELFDASKARQV